MGFDEAEDPVELVVTLCQDEVCPVWLGARWRVHWGLPDPAPPSAPEDRRLVAGTTHWLGSPAMARDHHQFRREYLGPRGFLG